ncbi:muts domain V-domain-containing protein [Chaetomium fimeti]|uniref:DNA mismatch repair protein MSH3 n=1 Tax=Chaetomium fimeti TaxID=1854472 RepID=A0AAE0HQM5_9PEZI|nr:muts domain V-domain-containing protein [Chaetomium fimeti]
MSGAMRNTAAESTTETHLTRSPDRPTRHTHDSSPPANIGDPASWLLPRPFRHEVELPFVGETPYEETEETESACDIASLSSTTSFSQTQGNSRASTPDSLRKGTHGSQSMRSPYFRRGESTPGPTEVRSSSPFYDTVNAKPLHHEFSTTARATESFPGGSFARRESSNFPQQSRFTASNQQQPPNDSTDNTQNHGYSEAQASLSYDSDTRPLKNHPSTTFRARLASPRLWRTHDTNSECGYGPSVVSGAVTQTLTPNTSPYQRHATGMTEQETVGNTTSHTFHGSVVDKPGEQWCAPAHVNRQPPLPRYEYQDSSIISPLSRPSAPQNAPRPIANLDNDRPGTLRQRAESGGLNILDLDFSSDSESDGEDVDSRYNLGAGRSQRGNKGQKPQSGGVEPMDEEDRVVCAISESRSSDMIGVAVINMTVGEIDLFRIVNDDRYHRLAETLWGTSTWPQIFVVLKKAMDQHSKSTVTDCLEKEFPHAEIVPLDREHWNESEGLKLIGRFAWRADIKAILQDLERNFYVSCAFSAVMAYVEEETEVTFRDNSLRIRYRQPADTMGLDRSTITCLELFQNVRNSKGTTSTLFGLLNNTLTPQGRRMIRSALFQPSTNRELITARHEAVEELSSNEDLFTEVRASLKRLFHIDVERSIPWVTLNTAELRVPLQDGVALIQGRHQISMPSHEELQGAEKDMNHLLMVKAYLGGVQSVQETLEAAGCTSKLCKWVLFKCRQENTAPIATFIEGSIEQDAIYSKAPIDIRNNRMWAVKADPHSVLDGARQMYRDCTNEMHQYVEELNTVFQEHLGTAPQLRLANDNHYYLRFQWSDVERELMRSEVASEDERPARMQHRRPRLLGGVGIVNGIRRKHHYDCQTLELIQRSSQIQRHADIVTAQCDTFIMELKKSLLEHAEVLLAVNEAIAVLDMLCSFAHLATTQNYVRPIISDNLVLKGARHPVVEARKQNFVPNDVYLGDHGARFQVVTGGNMSGKSTFIRSVALIQILAQVGSFVPATYAAIPVCDRLFTRLSTEDKPESNLGTFGVEMTEMNMILRRVTDNSLVIIDELGRGTSTKEGLGIALAMSEELIKTGCRVFFATHFTELARILNTTKQSSVLNVHVVGESTKTADTTQISLPHTIAPGPVKNEDYGLDLSRRFLPERVVDNAEQVCNFLHQRGSNRGIGPATRAAKQNKLILALPGLLKQANDSTMDESALASYLKKLQTEFTIRMNIAADDDAQQSLAGKDIEPAVDLPTLAKPSEEERGEWRKKCDAAESRVMHANMALPDDKRRVSPTGKGTESLLNRVRAGMEDDATGTISQPTPINRGSMIEELRKGACTPTTRVATPSSVTTDLPDPHADSIMSDVLTGDNTPKEVDKLTGNRPRAMSISSGSNYDEEMLDVDDEENFSPTGSEQHPAAGAYLDDMQPLERFQPLRDWYARDQAAEPSGAAPEERSACRSLGRSRSATQEFLRGLHEEVGEGSQGEGMEL